MSVTLHTSLGDIKAVPRAAENFLAHCAAGTYDDVLWHRNMKGFMVQVCGALTQTGDPSGTGKGGQSIWGAPFEDEIRPTLKVRGCLTQFHARGVVAMANSGPNTNKSQVRDALMQFFITYSKQPHLDGKYTIFGKVIDGAELGGTLEALENVPVNAKHRPLEEVRMRGVTIHANPIAQRAAHDT